MAYTLDPAVYNRRGIWTDRGRYEFHMRHVSRYEHYIWRISVAMLIEALEDMTGDILCIHAVYGESRDISVYLSRTGDENSRMHCLIHWVSYSNIIDFVGTYRSTVDAAIIDMSSYDEVRSHIDCIIHSMGERKII